MQDYDETYPSECAADWSLTLPITLQPYIKSNAAFFCPDDPGAGTKDGWLGINISFGYNGYLDSSGKFYGLMGFSSVAVRNAAEVTQPANTVMIADLSSADNTKNTAATWAVNGANVNPIWGPGAMIGNMDACLAGWFTNCNIPNGKLPVSASYDGAGQNGQVSTPHVSKSIANFCFADGHAKAMKPSATNPNGTNDANNMWDATRS